MKHLHRIYALYIVLAFAVAGCATPAESYVAGDRATFEAVAPEYLKYVANDAKLDGEKAERRQRLINSWRLRIEQAEAGGTKAAPSKSGTGL